MTRERRELLRRLAQIETRLVKKLLRQRKGTNEK
jgi:hypothetical protein